MKTLFLVAFSFAVITSAFGIQNDFRQTANIIALDQDGDKRTEVKYAELPQAVRDAMTGTDYRGWVVQETAYLVTKKDGAGEYYEITLTRPGTDETRTVKLDKNGELFKKDKDNNNHKQD
ncbi:MAG: hypothetical protein IH597_11065 [Bacteroidales bacterium]|nr:hypothetical protein [Bacteroidales bacterium]